MAEVVAVVVIGVIGVVVAATVGRTSGVFQLLEVFLQGMWAAQFEQLHLPSEFGLSESSGIFLSKTASTENEQKLQHDG